MDIVRSCDGDGLPSRPKRSRATSSLIHQLCSSNKERGEVVDGKVKVKEVVDVFLMIV